MNGIIEFLHQLVRTGLRLALLAAAVVFLLSLLAATVVLMLAVSVWALVTGRKPDPAKVFGQFRQTSARYTRGAWSAGRGTGSQSQDIVDIPADAVRDVSNASDARPGKEPSHGKDPMARMFH